MSDNFEFISKYVILELLSLLLNGNKYFFFSLIFIKEIFASLIALIDMEVIKSKNEFSSKKLKIHS